MPTELPDRTRSDFIGIAFDEYEIAEVIRHVQKLSLQDKFSFVVTPNVDHAIQLSRASADSPIGAAYDRATLVLCDSRILDRLARTCGLSLSVVPGSDLTRELFAQTLTAGDRIAIVGGDAAMLSALEQRFPGPSYHQHVPPMGFIRNDEARSEAASFVEALAPHYTFIATGFPQSEVFAAQLVERGKATGVGLCIGASIEFIVGTKQRAPRWMQKLSLEWLFRLLSEPRRLWRRYLVDGPAIFAIVLRWRKARNRA